MTVSARTSPHFTRDSTRAPALSAEALREIRTIGTGSVGATL
jgi:hypothetical protein